MAGRLRTQQPRLRDLIKRLGRPPMRAMAAVSMLQASSYVPELQQSFYEDSASEFDTNEMLLCGPDACLGSVSFPLRIFAGVHLRRLAAILVRGGGVEPLEVDKQILHS